MHSIRQEHRLVDVVRDQEDRLVELGLHREEPLLHQGTSLGVERTERLVEQHDLGFAEQRAHQRGPLAHAA